MPCQPCYASESEPWMGLRLPGSTTTEHIVVERLVKTRANFKRYLTMSMNSEEAVKNALRGEENPKYDG